MSVQVSRLMERVEHAFVKHFANGNHRKGMNTLRPTAKRKRHKIKIFIRTVYWLLKFPHGGSYYTLIGCCTLKLGYGDGLNNKKFLGINRNSPFRHCHADPSSRLGRPMSGSQHHMGGGLEFSGSSSSHSSVMRRRKYRCKCDVESPLLTCKTLENYGRRFYGCSLFKLYGRKVCNFFVWVDEEMNEQQKTVMLELLAKITELEQRDEQSKRVEDELKVKLIIELEKKDEHAKRIEDEFKMKLKFFLGLMVFSWVIVIMLVFALLATQLLK